MKRNIIAIAIVVSLFGCQRAERKAEKAEKADDAIDAQEMAIPLLSDSTAAAKIIKTADMRFRVKDVQHTKAQLSNTIKAQGGTVAEFSIQSSILEKDKIKQSSDSLKEITSYRTEGYMVVKVPSEKLDDFTNSIATMAVFVDNQSMKMDDQSIAYLANRMKAQNRVEAANQMGNLPAKKTGNIKTSLSLKDDYVDRKLENMGIDARVRYSTITLNFYQDNTVKSIIIANDNLYDYRPAFANRLWLSFVNGWTIFKEIVVALANLWMLILIGIALFFAIRHLIRKDKMLRDISAKNLAENKPL